MEVLDFHVVYAHVFLLNWAGFTKGAYQVNFIFYNDGMRNAIISSYQLLEGRQDFGALRENHLVSERKKKELMTEVFLATHTFGAPSTGKR